MFMQNRNIDLNARVGACLFGILLATGGLLSIERVSAAEFGNTQATRRVLIASENTAFKNRLASRLVDELNDGATYIKLIDHQKGQLAGEDANGYGAVLVINSGVGSRVRPWVTEWLNDEARNTEHVIVLTTQRDRWTPRVAAHIDSVTSPSVPSRINDLAKDLVRRIERLL